MLIPLITGKFSNYGKFVKHYGWICMANTAFDFLTESFLFNDSYIEDNYKKVSEQELSSELNKYREYIKEKHASIVKETQNI